MENLFPKSWEKYVDEVKDLVKNKFAFAIQTDTHVDFDNSSGKNWSDIDVGHNVRIFAEKTGLDFFANLGDMIEGYPRDTTEDMKKDMKELVRRYTEGAKCPVLTAIGNHDNNHMWAEKNDGEEISYSELLENIIHPIKATSDKFVFSGNVAYYYIDFDKVRVIVLNSQDMDNTTSEFIIREKQIEWFKNEALHTDKAVIVMCHTPLLDSLTDNKVINSEKILEALYEFKNSGKTVIGGFYGHNHEQKHIVENGVLHIGFEKLGTRAEVVIVDIENKKIITKAIGDVEKYDATIVDREFEF